MKNILLLAGLLLLLPFAHARDCADLQNCEELRISLDECLDDRFRIPSGPYIQQRCGDDSHCIQSTFSYDSELDELSFFTNGSYYRVNTDYVSNICKLKKQGFQLNMNPRVGFFGTTHPNATIRYTGTHDKETRILSGNGAVAESERTPVERWIMEPHNNFQQSCSNIRYYPSADMLTANCAGSEEYKYPYEYIGISKVTSSAVIPNVSLYNDNNSVLLNDDGVLRVSIINKDNYLSTTERHTKIRQLCRDWNSVHDHLDGYEVCSSKKTFHVHNCDAEKTVFDEIHDTLFVRCSGHKGVFHLKNATTCLNHNYDIYLEKEYSWVEYYRAYIVVWKGLSCRVNTAKFSERPVL